MGGFGAQIAGEAEVPETMVLFWLPGARLRDCRPNTCYTRIWEKRWRTTSWCAMDQLTGGLQNTKRQDAQ